MKHFLKGIIVVAGVMIVDIIINVICNINGIDLDSAANTLVCVVCSMFIYNRWIGKENNKES